MVDVGVAEAEGEMPQDRVEDSRLRVEKGRSARSGAGVPPDPWSSRMDSHLAVIDANAEALNQEAEDALSFQVVR